MEHPHDALDPLSAPRRADVARDLDAIFADRSSAPRATSLVRTVTTRRRRWLIPTVVGVLALAGASAGMALFVGDVSPVRPVIAAPKALAVNKTAPTPQPPIRTVVTEQATPDTAPVRLLPQPPVASSVAQTSPPVRGTDPRIERPVSRARFNDTPRQPVLTDGCDDLQDEERAWCMRPSLLAAHRQLRTTYDAARRAGVDSDVLARIQGRWTNLQRHAAERPDDTMDSYRDLRLQLLDLIDEQRSTGSDR